jgi:immune inhibitor A
MVKNQNKDYLTYFNSKYPQLRHLDPAIYKKLGNTEKFLKEGIKPEEFVDRGGVDYQTYNVLHKLWKEKNNITASHKNDTVITKLPYARKSINKVRPIIGHKKALVLLMEFKDKKNNTPPQHFNNLLFNSDFQYSLKNYYMETSCNQLEIDGNVNNEWYVANYNRSNYVDTTFVNGHFIKAQTLVSEAIRKAVASHKINFSDYAVNGEIEMLIIIYAGSGLDTKLNAKFIRPHTDRLLNPIQVQPGIYAKNYCIIPELPSDDVGCFCHEMGHLLGLPDLYKEGFSPVVGGWCLMGVGDHNNGGRTPAHPSAWCKIHLGWIEPTIIKGNPQKNTISAVKDSDPHNKIYKLDVRGTNGKEYFLIENRQQTGFDVGLPASGLLIWHVNENQYINYAPNHDPKKFFITLKQSDGKSELQSNMIELQKLIGIQQAQKDLTGDSGDPFPGDANNKSFDDNSIPNSRTSKNTRSCIVVDSISNSDPIMTANMGLNCYSQNKNKQT